MGYIELFKDYYKKNNKEFTDKIKKIIDTIFEIHAHFTHDQLSKKINKIFDYDTNLLTDLLDDLIATGLIRKIYYQDKIYYEQIYGYIHHDHLICAECNKIIPFRNEEIEKAQEKIVKQKNFTLLKHSLVIIGICPECNEKKEIKEKYEFLKEDKGLDKAKIIPLGMIASGEKVKVVRFEGKKHFYHKLISMGLSIGDTVEVLSNDFHGPFLIKVNNTRLGIGNGMINKILVEKIKS